jgi:hypothetical protein
MAMKHPRKRWTLGFPLHRFQPEDLLRFILLKPFEDSWDELGLDDDDLCALQLTIMLDPKRPPVVKRTGGLRKIRFAPAGWNVGKSGAVRVGYTYLEEYGTALLIIAYGKNEKDDLTPAEERAISGLVKRIKKEFADRVIT